MSAKSRTTFTGQRAETGSPIRSPRPTPQQAASEPPATPSTKPREYHPPTNQKLYRSFLRSFFTTGADRLLVGFGNTCLLLATCIFLHHAHAAVLTLSLYVNATNGSPATIKACEILHSQMEVMDSVHLTSVWAPVAFCGAEYGPRIRGSTRAWLWLLGMEVLLLGAEVGGRWAGEKEYFLPRS